MKGGWGRRGGDVGDEAIVWEGEVAKESFVCILCLYG